MTCACTNCERGPDQRKGAKRVYFDTKPCHVCGAEVELRPREGAQKTVEPDGTVDERVCTNPECPTRDGDSGRQA